MRLFPTVIGFTTSVFKSRRTIRRKNGLENSSMTDYAIIWVVCAPEYITWFSNTHFKRLPANEIHVANETKSEKSATYIRNPNIDILLPVSFSLADDLSLESEWQQVSSSLQDSSQFSGWSQQCCSLDVSTHPLISKSASLCTNPLVTVPRALITIDITVTFMFHSLFFSIL